MDESHFVEFVSDQNEHRRRVKKVGSISLVLSARRREYFLASIDVLNRHLGRTATLPEVVSTLEDVVHYGLWDIDNSFHGAHRVIKNEATVQRKFIETLADLRADNLVDSDMTLTGPGSALLERYKPQPGTPL